MTDNQEGTMTHPIHQRDRLHMIRHLTDTDGHHVLASRPDRNPMDLTMPELDAWHHADHVPQEGAGPRDGHNHPPRPFWTGLTDQALRSAALEYRCHTDDADLLAMADAIDDDLNRRTAHRAALASGVDTNP